MMGEIQNKRYVVEINVVRLYLNIVLTPQRIYYLFWLFHFFLIFIYASEIVFCFNLMVQIFIYFVWMFHCELYTDNFPNFYFNWIKIGMPIILWSVIVRRCSSRKCKIIHLYYWFDIESVAVSKLKFLYK